MTGIIIVIIVIIVTYCTADVEVNLCILLWESSKLLYKFDVILTVHRP